jgi:hypothetical protein
MNILKYVTLVIFTLLSGLSFGGDYDCRGGTAIECAKSCVSIGDCQHPCAAVYNSTCKPLPAPGGSQVKKKIQNCEVASIYELGYGSGNKHEFCLNRGWNGGEVFANCWKAPSGNGAVDCPRLNAFYNVAGKPGSCDHLTVDDAFLLHVCGH